MNQDTLFVSRDAAVGLIAGVKYGDKLREAEKDTPQWFAQVAQTLCSLVSSQFLDIKEACYDENNLPYVSAAEVSRILDGSDQEEGVAFVTALIGAQFTKRRGELRQVQ